MNLNLKLVKAADARNLINYRVVSLRGTPEFTLDAHLRFLNVAPNQMLETKAKLRTGELLLMEQMQAQVRKTPSSGYASGSSPAMGSTSSQAEPPVVARPGDVTADRAARLDALLESPERSSIVPKEVSTNSETEETHATSQSTPPSATTVTVSKSKYPESYEHAQSTGNPSGPFTKDAANAKQRRRANLKGKKKVSEKDWDEWPPAQTLEGSEASMKLIGKRDNRGSGATIGNQTRKLADGDKFEVNWGE